MNCEMCGIQTERFITSLVEGVELKVCKNCTGFGKTLTKPRLPVKHKRITSSGPEIMQSIVENYSKIIRDKREKMGLKQKELARFLAEKESLIHKMESGSITPSLDLARKLERQLGILLVEQKEIKNKTLKTDSKDFTIGDMIKIK